MFTTTSVNWSRNMHRSISYLVFNIAMLVSLSALAGTNTGKCTPQLAQSAMDNVDEIRSWGTLNLYYKRYRNCDDGSISEGVSEAIARLLVDRIESIPDLEKYLIGDPKFNDYIVSHINSTLNTDDLQSIKTMKIRAGSRILLKLRRKLSDAAMESLKSQ